MKRLGGLLLIGGCLGAAGAYTWLRLLTPEARQGILDSSQAIVQAFQKVKNQAESMVGSYAEEDNERANKEDTEKQWAILGF